MSPDRALRAWLAFGAAATLVGLWVLAGITDDVVAQEELSSSDPTVASWLADHRTHWLTRSMQAVTWLGSGWVTVPVLVLAALLLPVWRDRRRTLALVLTVSMGSAVLVTIGKLLTVRPRPVVGEVLTTATGYAFPSGHSAQAAAAYGVLALLISLRVPRAAKPLVWLAATALVLLIGFSRLYLGVHWLTDVLAGYALGACWLAVVVAAAVVHDRLRPDSRPRVNV
ncbi:phosphatase PAP2 family protein [Catellatospora methionotrophica]|uniref:phosphatase PAP2 family protein n=1 Tax=Catellatospora methionotrophica TaxID=121620 RepID=UPI0014093766|nr:phosphatase PAP2 family protein [Catellatospora methionotrophica]